MPVIKPFEFPIFFKTKVLKRKALLEKTPKNLLDATPLVKTRNLHSTWNRQVVFSGHLNSCRFGISMITFLNNKEPIIMFNQTWAHVNNYTRQISGGRFYYYKVSSIGQSIYQTCLLSEFAIYVASTPTIPLELKKLALQFKFHASKPPLPQELLRKELGKSLTEVKNKLKLKKVPLKIQNEYLKKIKKANKFKNPEAFKKKLLKDLEKTTIDTFFNGKSKIITNKSLKEVKQIRKGNISIKRLKNPIKREAFKYTGISKKQKGVSKAISYKKGNSSIGWKKII